jgi:hypothetical protein
MKSPFPGMDPYIEARGLWKDFHDNLIAEINRLVCAELPPSYVARIENRSYIAPVESEEREDRHFEPDIAVSAPRSRKSARGKNGGREAAATPQELDQPVALRAFLEEEFIDRFIDIYETEPERRLVTSIEILSPSNKERGGPGWKRYLRKRQSLLLGKANLVEIDLLRGGQRMPMLDPLPDSPYYVLVAREKTAPLCRVWRAFFDRPLPTVPVPLAHPDPDIPLALQPLVDAIYERSRHSTDIDYAQSLEPPLTPEQTAWLQQQRQASTAEPPRPPKKRPRRRG